MIVTVMKTTFGKAKPREITYRSYKKFDNVSFRKDLKNELNCHADNINKYQLFEKVFLNVLERHAPINKKIGRANEAPYMTKALRKAIASRSRLENTFHLVRTKESRELFKKQKVIVVYCTKRKERNFIII